MIRESTEQNHFEKCNRTKQSIVTYLDWEGPKRGFSERGWNENLPRVGRAQSPWELVQQSLTSIVAMKTPMSIITNTDTTHVSPRRRRRRQVGFTNGSWGRSGGNFAGDSLMSMNSELSAIDFSRECSRFYSIYLRGREREREQSISSLSLAGNVVSSVI